MALLIRMFTDGSCCPNPGKGGAGCVLLYKQHSLEISMALGYATNNISELEAIKLGLESITNREVPVVIYTDSKYCIKVLTSSKRYSKNTRLIEEIRTIISMHNSVKFEWVKSHSDCHYNEIADRLARRAMNKHQGYIRRRRGVVE